MVSPGASPHLWSPAITNLTSNRAIEAAPEMPDVTKPRGVPPLYPAAWPESCGAIVMSDGVMKQSPSVERRETLMSSEDAAVAPYERGELHYNGRLATQNQTCDREQVGASAWLRSAGDMVLELGQEGAAFNYVVSAHKPTSVQHSAMGHFTSATDLNLIIS